MDPYVRARFTEFAADIGAELLVPFDHELFEDSERDQYDITSTGEHVVGFDRLQEGSITSAYVCARCGARGGQRFLGPQSMLPSLDELDSMSQRWVDGHSQTCRSQEFVSFSKAVDAAVASDIRAQCALARHGLVVPSHLLIVYADSHIQVVPMSRYGEEFQDSGCHAGIQDVICEEFRTSPKQVEAVLFVMDLLSCVDANGSNSFVMAVDGLKGGSVFVPWNAGPEADPTWNWTPLEDLVDTLDGILVKEFPSM